MTVSGVLEYTVAGHVRLHAASKVPVAGCPICGAVTTLRIKVTRGAAKIADLESLETMPLREWLRRNAARRRRRS